MKNKSEEFSRRKVENHLMSKSTRNPHGQYGHSNHFFYTVKTLDNKELLVANDTRELMIKLLIYHGVQKESEELELSTTILRRS